MKALYVPAFGEPAVWEEGVAKGQGFSLSFLQDAVGGYIECVYSGQYVIYCNEEGKLRNLPFNLLATELWYESLDSDPEYSLSLLDGLVGDVIVVGATDRFGNDTGLSDSQVDFLMEFFGDIQD